MIDRWIGIYLAASTLRLHLVAFCTQEAKGPTAPPIVDNDPPTNTGGGDPNAVSVKDIPVASTQAALHTHLQACGP